MRRPFPNLRKLAPTGALLAVALVLLTVQLARGRSEATAPEAGPLAGGERAGDARSSLVAMARLEPASRIVRLAAKSDDLVGEIRVREGEAVTRGQVLLLLESHALRQAEIEAAELALERTALLPHEIEAQQARLRAFQAELEHARAEVLQQRALSEKGYMAGKEFRDAQLRVRRAEEDRSEATALLRQLEQRLDLERREAENQLAQARARLEQTVVRAPMDGTVLDVTVRPGERAGGRTLVQMGLTDPMYAMAEVHANDIRLVREGQRARFSSPALPRELDGVVEDVGVIIHNNGVYGEDPSAPQGVRVFEVRVRLDESGLAAGYTNLEGQVRIFLRES